MARVYLTDHSEAAANRVVAITVILSGRFSCMPPHLPARTP
jgi:hypothetical protein